MLLIFDEIATGFGRTGELFAAVTPGSSPDIMCVGKALTGGLHVARRRAVHAGGRAGDRPGRARRTDARAHVHGNPLACAVANASLDVLLGPAWLRRGCRPRSRIEAGLRAAEGAGEVAGVADVRVLGAIGVLQLDHEVDMAAATAAAAAAGVWLRPFRDLVYAMPPYICPAPEIDQITSAMVAVAESVG